VVAESGAPRGSIYFHFPGGKEELAVAATAVAAAELEQIMAAASAQAANATDFVRELARIVGERLESSGYHRGCAIATMVLELAPDVETLRAAFDEGFGHWRAGLAGQFERYGYQPARAGALAALLMSTLEGALIMSRAARSLEPLSTATKALISMLEPAPKRRRAAAS
jgi:TetR/AcrR family transcriptional repressor of lmrAB and yxaGH operons